MKRQRRTRGKRDSFNSARPFEFPARNAGKNPKAIRLRAEPSGDNPLYQEIVVRALRGSKAIADFVIGLDSRGNLRVVCTANGEGDGGHAVALFPELPADGMVKRTICDPAAELTPSKRQSKRRTSSGDQ